MSELDWLGTALITWLVLSFAENIIVAWKSNDDGDKADKKRKAEEDKKP